MRIRDDISATQIALRLNVIPAGSTAHEDTIDKVLNIATPTDIDINVDLGLSQPAEIDVALDPANTGGISASTGDSFWVPFYVKLAPEKRVNMNVAITLPTTVDGRGVLHVNDVRFATSAGINIPCTSEIVNMKRVHQVLFEQTPALNAFMQVT